MARARPQLVVGLTAVAVLGGCTSEERRTEAPSRIGSSVILVLGDGMAAAHREAGRLDQVGLDGQLAMGSMPVTGEQTTDSADPDDPVTDSAAAATALATGQKTYNGAISVDVDGDPLTPLGVEAAEAGKATGLVTTAEVNDASPAAFFANASDRDEEADIITQYIEDTGPDVVLGGGAEEWQDLLDDAEDGGYTHVTDSDELDSVRGDRLLGLSA